MPGASADRRTETRRALSWDHGVASVESLGGMLGPTSFVLPDGRQIAPFQIAPWASEPGGEELPAILRRLRGEWPCVPFGFDADRAAQGEWPGSQSAGTMDPLPHGYGSNSEWRLSEVSSQRLSLAIDYPEEHPIRSLERHIVPDPAQPAIDFELIVNVRRDCQLPIGLHPCFRLPATPGAMRIEVDEGIAAATFPGDVDASSILVPGQFIESWKSAPLRQGGMLDVSQVPLAANTEDLLQLLDMPGHAALWNSAEGYRVRLSWNKEHFPSALLWFSNRGRQAAPWNGRHLALGLEPICSAFDLGQQISAGDNPIAARGIATARRFRAGERFVTRYRVAVEAAPLG